MKDIENNENKHDWWPKIFLQELIDGGEISTVVPITSPFVGKWEPSFQNLDNPINVVIGKFPPDIKLVPLT